jgi:two-component system response regulator
MHDADILLVEDNRDDLDLALDAFEKHRSRVHVARDGVEAVEALFGENGKPRLRPRLILLDLKLPRLDGMEVLKRVKSDPRTKAIPVVVLTSSGQEGDLEACYRLGANSYIVKPVHFNQFVETAEAIGAYWLRHNRALSTSS